MIKIDPENFMIDVDGERRLIDRYLAWFYTNDLPNSSTDRRFYGKNNGFFTTLGDVNKFDWAKFGYAPVVSIHELRNQHPLLFGTVQPLTAVEQDYPPSKMPDEKEVFEKFKAIRKEESQSEDLFELVKYFLTDYQKGKITNL